MPGKMDKSREDLLQTAVRRMMSVMRHVHHSGPHPGPPPGEPPLSPPQANIFFTIARQRRGVSVKELAEETGVTPGAVTQFVDPLVAKGLVMREGDPSDRRIVRLKITDLARERFEKFRREHLSSFSKVFDVLTEAEIKSFIALLEKIESSQAGKDKLNAEPDKTP